MDRMISIRSPLLIALLICLILAVAGVFVTTLNVLLLAAAGALLGVLLNGTTHGVSRILPLTYGWSFAMIIFLLIAAAAAGIYRLGSVVSEQASQLSTQLASSVESLQKQLAHYEWLPSQAQIQQDLSQALPSALAGAQSALWFLTGLLVILFIGLYVAAEPDMYRRGIVKLVPPASRRSASDVLSRLRESLLRWSVGRLFSMTVVGFATAIALWLLDVPLAATLGILAALLTFIPNIGPIMAAVPQILLALNVDARTALYVVIFNVLLQTVESYLLTPLVQRYVVSLPPALTITTQLLLGVIVGVIGVVIAAPLILVVMVLTEMLYVERQPGAESASTQ